MPSKAGGAAGGFCARQVARPRTSPPHSSSYADGSGECFSHLVSMKNNKNVEAIRFPGQRVPRQGLRRPGSRCGAWQNGRHLRAAQRGLADGGAAREGCQQSRELLYSVCCAVQQIARAARLSLLFVKFETAHSASSEVVIQQMWILRKFGGFARCGHSPSENGS